MRTATIGGRLALLGPDGPFDVERASGGRFGADPQAVFEQWDSFREWAASAPAGEPVTGEVGPPVPAPRQIFAIGLNYRAHAAESGVTVPESPTVFTKFVTSLTGQDAQVVLPSDKVDWEVELVAVIGRRAEHVDVGRAWEHVAGLTIGQDLSERAVQLTGSVPQFSLGKSFPGFAPLGPELVTPDELANPDDLGLTCAIDGETVQKSSTGDLVFSVPELVARLSAICPLLPGDLIFTGTPSGVGMGRTPQRFLAPGELLTSRIDGLGELRTHLVARP